MVPRSAQRVTLALVLADLALLAALGVGSAARAQPTGHLVLRLSLPHVNSFYLRPVGEPGAQVNTGFWGFGMGLRYRYAASRSVGLAVSAATDIGVPVPAAVDYLGEHEFMTTYAVDLTHGHRWRRFMVDYGLSYAVNQWERKVFIDPGEPPATREPVSRRSHMAGLFLSVHRKLNDRFALGLIYRPGLYRFGGQAGFRYEHVVSLALAWDLGLI